MNAQQQRLEIESAVANDDDLAVDDASLRQRCEKRRGELGKIAVHRFLVAALQHDLIAIAKNERPESIPLRLEEPAVAGGQLIGSGRQHRLQRRRKWEIQAPSFITEGHTSCSFKGGRYD